MRLGQRLELSFALTAIGGGVAGFIVGVALDIWWIVSAIGHFDLSGLVALPPVFGIIAGAIVGIGAGLLGLVPLAALRGTVRSIRRVVYGLASGMGTVPGVVFLVLGVFPWDPVATSLVVGAIAALICAIVIFPFVDHDGRRPLRAARVSS